MEALCCRLWLVFKFVVSVYPDKGEAVCSLAWILFSPGQGHGSSEIEDQMFIRRDNHPQLSYSCSHLRLGILVQDGKLTVRIYLRDSAAPAGIHELDFKGATSRAENSHPFDGVSGIY